MKIFHQNSVKPIQIHQKQLQKVKLKKIQIQINKKIKSKLKKIKLLQEVLRNLQLLQVQLLIHLQVVNQSQSQVLIHHHRLRRIYRKKLW